MCAAPNSTTVPTSSTSATKPVPKWLKMKQQNKSSAGKQTAKPTVQKSSGSAQKPHDETRNSKRARWAKKAKPVAKPIVRKGPEKEYISACCSVPARKPRAGMKETVKDPESGKTKDKPKGLGHWRCTACGKVAKVTPRKPESKPEVHPIVPGTMAAIVFPGKTHFTVTFEGEDLGRGTEVPIATA